MKWYHDINLLTKFIFAKRPDMVLWIYINEFTMKLHKSLEIKKRDRRQELHQHCMFAVGILFTTPITPMAIIAVVLIFLSVWD